MALFKKKYEDQYLDATHLDEPQSIQNFDECMIKVLETRGK